MKSFDLPHGLNTSHPTPLKTAAAEHSTLEKSVQPVHPTTNVHTKPSAAATFARYGTVTAGGLVGGVLIYDRVRSDTKDLIKGAENLLSPLLGDPLHNLEEFMHGLPSNISGITGGITGGAVGAFTGNVVSVLAFGLTVFVTYEIYHNFS